MSLQQKFESIVNSSLTPLSSEDLKSIGLGFWYESYTPKLDGMDSLQLRRAGYLLDFFMSFNCVSDTRQLELLALTQKIRAKLPDLQSELMPITSHSHLDPLAQEWHLNENISAAIQPLLKYQTRHYVHS